MDRRSFLLAAAGASLPLRGNAATLVRAGLVWRRAREIVRAGQLGRIVFCRSVVGGASRRRLLDRIDCVQFAFDDAAPVWVSAQASPPGGPANLTATFRYPGFVASYEQRAGAEEATVICGAAATLVISLPGSGPVRSRRGPAAVDAGWLLETALREGRAIDCSRKVEVAWT